MMDDILPMKNIPARALVVEKPGEPFLPVDIILDEVRDDEILVEIKYTGLCHTDLVVQNGGMPTGDYPAILGHEGAGIVRRIGPAVKNKLLKVGDRVILSFHTCRKCSHCIEGHLGTCPKMTEINFTGVRLSDQSSPASTPGGRFLRGQFFGQSSFSTLSVVAEDSVVRCEVSESELAMLAPLGCGFLTGAGTVINALNPAAGSSIAILGMGGVGLSALMAAKAMGVERIIAVDILQSKLDISASLGATDTINSAGGPLSGAIRDLVNEGVDYVVDTTGVAPLIEEGIKSLAHAGTLALVGVPRPGSSIAIDSLEFLLACKRLVGVIEAASDPAKLIPQLIELYRKGKFPLEKLTKLYPAASIATAINEMKMGTVIKPVLSWDGF